MAEKDFVGEIQLDKLYKQPTDGYGRYELGSATSTYREEWKGSMTDVMSAYEKIKKWKPTASLTTLTYSAFKNLIGTSKLVSSYDPPSTGSNTPWSLSSVEIQELDAGDNALLILEWNVSNVIVNPQEEPEFDEKWGITWQSYATTLYAFCGNTKDHIESEDDKDMHGQIASRTAIESWFNQPAEFNNIKFKGYYNDGVNVVKKLNPAEQNIANKILVGKDHPTFHYPIVSKVQVTEVPKRDIKNVIKSYKMDTPDVIMTEKEIGMPFTVPGGFKWVSQGSNVQITINKKTNNATITITSSYNGSIDPDKNFYGTATTGKDVRWQFGKA